MSISLIIVLALTLVAEFANGLTDAPNAIATVVATRVLSPYKAVIMAAVLNIAGALLTGTAVASTIGKDIIQPEAVGLHTVAAALLTIVIWTGLAWRLGLPTSKTHEMVAGLAGAGIATAGTSVLIWDGWQKVLIGLGLSTILGFVFGLITMSCIYWIFHRTLLSTVKSIFGKLQIVSSAFMAFSHGSNDGQKFMGIFSLALVLGGVLPQFEVPVWVILICGVVMGAGTIFGGWRILKTMGFRLTHLEPAQGFAAETSASGAIILASILGVPLSTTHTVTTSIMGVGSTRRFSAVRWSVAQQIVMTWLLTFPACAILGYVFAWLLQWIMV
jgi:PiT family inorganic phosphate transporter